MTTYPIIAATQDNTLLPQGADDLLNGIEENIWVTSSTLQSRYYLAGALKPWPGIQDGFILAGGLKGLSPNFKHIDIKTARQPGVTNTGTTYDVLEMDMQLQAHGATAQGISKAVSEWVGMWDPTVLNTLEYWTLDRGYWYMPARLSKSWPDITKLTARVLKTRTLTHTCRCDTGFWFGFPSIDTFTGNGSGYLHLVNIGDQVAWPTVLLTGPGVFEWSNGVASGTTTTIVFGPLDAGQQVLITTNKRQRNVIDLSGSLAGVFTPNSAAAKFIEHIINFVTNNNVPPLLQQFESLFGIIPAQSPLYTLLSGQYTNPIPGVQQPQWATRSDIAVNIIDGNSNSQIVARIDPQRRWPE